MRNAIGAIIGAALCVFGVIWLRSDAADRDSGWVLLGVGGFFIFLWLVGLLAGSGQKRILKDGTPGMCEILAISETGVFVNERPRLLLQVRTWSEGVEPQTSQVKRVIGHDMLGRLQPGAVLPIRFAPGGDDNDWIFDPAEPAQMPTSTPSSAGDMTGELERLTMLHQQGALTDAEFTAAKQRLLP